MRFTIVCKHCSRQFEYKKSLNTKKCKFLVFHRTAFSVLHSQCKSQATSMGAQRGFPEMISIHAWSSHLSKAFDLKPAQSERLIVNHGNDFRQILALATLLWPPSLHNSQVVVALFVLLIISKLFSCESQFTSLYQTRRDCDITTSQSRTRTRPLYRFNLY